MIFQISTRKRKLPYHRMTLEENIESKEAVAKETTTRTDTEIEMSVRTCHSWEAAFSLVDRESLGHLIRVLRGIRGISVVRLVRVTCAIRRVLRVPRLIWEHLLDHISASSPNKHNNSDRPNNLDNPHHPSHP